MSNFFSPVNFGDVSITETVEENIIRYLDWNFVNIGARIDVRIPQSGLYGSFHKLERVEDERYERGTVWQSFHNNWLWEEGIDNTVNFSGVYVDNIFYDASTVEVDYPNGQIEFSSPVSGNVECEYTAKYITVEPAEKSGFLQDDTYRLDTNYFDSSSGNYIYRSDNRIQIPSVLVHVPAIEKLSPYELGTSRRRIQHNIDLYVITSSRSENQKICDIISSPHGKTLLLFDLNKVNNSGVYPLEYNGNKNPNAVSYPNLLVDAYGFGKMYIESIDTNFQTKIDKDFVVTSVTLTTEIIKSL